MQVVAANTQHKHDDSYANKKKQNNQPPSSKQFKKTYIHHTLTHSLPLSLAASVYLKINAVIISGFRFRFEWNFKRWFPAKWKAVCGVWHDANYLVQQLA